MMTFDLQSFVSGSITDKDYHSLLITIENLQDEIRVSTLCMAQQNKVNRIDLVTKINAVLSGLVQNSCFEFFNFLGLVFVCSDLYLIYPSSIHSSSAT